MVAWLHEHDGERTALWWQKKRTRPFTLADCRYGNCTHQNHQECKWKPIKRGTGCGANGDERQSLGSFVSYLVGFVKSASEESEEAMVKMGRPNAFIRDPIVTKKEWDQVHALGRRSPICGQGPSKGTCHSIES